MILKCFIPLYILHAWLTFFHIPGNPIPSLEQKKKEKYKNKQLPDPANKACLLLKAKAFVLCIPLRVSAWAESFSHCARPLSGATARLRQSMGAALAAEAGSGERGYPDPGLAGRGRWS